MGKQRFISKSPFRYHLSISITNRYPLTRRVKKITYS